MDESQGSGDVPEVPRSHRIRGGQIAMPTVTVHGNGTEWVVTEGDQVWPKTFRTLGDMHRYLRELSNALGVSFTTRNVTGFVKGQRRPVPLRVTPVGRTDEEAQR
jgi:hypothetical protein